MLYGTISGLCSDASCPVMSAGDKWQYLWCDGVKIKKPISVSAPAYVDCLMTWVESQLNDEDIFPIKFDAPFPKKSTTCSTSTTQQLSQLVAHCRHACARPPRFTPLTLCACSLSLTLHTFSLSYRFPSICATIYKRFFRIYVRHTLH